MAQATEAPRTGGSILDSKFPVLLPYFPELCVSDTEFRSFIQSVQTAKNDRAPEPVARNDKDNVSSGKENVVEQPTSAFMDGLLSTSARVHDKQSLAAEGKTLTANADVAHILKSPLVELFYDLKSDSTNIEPHLEAAWKEDPLATLKIIFNARSIHLGKSDRIATYRAYGWLYENHPQTMLINLPWLVRPIIPKPSPNKEAKEGKEEELKSQDKMEVDAEIDDEEFEIIASTNEKLDTADFDVKNGMAHGYWKDLVNLVVLAAEGKLSVDSDPKSVLNIEQTEMVNGSRRKRVREWDEKKAKEIRHKKREAQHSTVVDKLNNNIVYRALHLTVARLFATQLQRDLVLLKSGNKEDALKISLAAKWAPSLMEFHDKATFINSTIAEFIFPDNATVCPAGVPKTDREAYLKHARAKYRSEVLSPLRKALDVVERHISDETFADVKYAHVPSLAMDRYKGLFFNKDREHFEKYLVRVASGKSKISGAVLRPSTLVREVLGDVYARQSKKQKLSDMASSIISDGQWKSIVNRIKESGTLDSSIAVCDVSGSMYSPELSDKTTPIHSSIGLSLLIAEVAKPPFGGAFITFSSTPEVVKVGGEDDKRTFTEKAKHILHTNSGFDTNFVAVFEKLILPMALENKLTQDQMVKRVFVFSDMQFNQAESSNSRWTSSYDRIKKAYEEAGYELPEMIFWNLAAGASEYEGAPVKADTPGVALVSGYSTGQMKVFLEGGDFEEPEEEVKVDDEKGDGEDEQEDENKDDDGIVKVTKEKAKIDPLSVVRKAISHRAYSMLKVVD